MFPWFNLFIKWACFPGLQVRALVWLYSLWLLFCSNYDGLQPCWFVNLIVCGLPGNFLSNIDKHNPIIRVRLCSFSMAHRELSHILRFDICIDVCIPSLLMHYHAQTEILWYNIFVRKIIQLLSWWRNDIFYQNTRHMRK